MAGFSFMHLQKASPDRLVQWPQPACRPVFTGSAFAGVNASGRAGDTGQTGWGLDCFIVTFLIICAGQPPGCRQKPG